MRCLLNTAFRGAVASVLFAFGQAQAQIPDFYLTNYVVERQTAPPVPGLSSIARDIAVTPDGSRMVVGTSGHILAGCTHPTVNSITGAIYIYDYDGANGVWELNDAIKECTLKGFGQTVSISDDGTTILIGHNAAGSQNNGIVWVYREVNGSWVLEASFSDSDDILGQAVDLDGTGDLAVLVAPDQLGSYFSIQRRTGEMWEQEAFVGPFDAFSDLAIRAACSIDSDWAAVAAVSSSGPNAVHQLRLYEFDGGGWVYRQAIPFSDASWGSGVIGGDVEIDSGRMIVGQGGCCGNPGFVRIYELNADTGLWEQVFEEIGASGDTLGFDVDILGDRAIATRDARNDARHYERVGGAWRFAGTLDRMGLGSDSGQSGAVTERGFLVGAQTFVGSVSRFGIEEYAAPVAICSIFEDFEGVSEIPQSLVAFEAPCSLRYVENGALVLERPSAGCNEYHNVLLALGDVIEGDFDLSFDWETEPLPLLASGQNTFPAAVQILDAVTNGLEMRLERVQVDTLLNACEPSPGFHKCWDRIAGPDTCAASVAATNTLAASYRITREGTTWRAFYKEPGDPGWIPFRTATLTDAPVRFGLEQFGSVGATKTRFDNLSLTTQAGCAGCNDADLAEPFGVLNFFDVSAYLALYNVQSPAADLAAPFGSFNFFDVSAYLDLYNAGCP